jgi:hypothetical protein
MQDCAEVFPEPGATIVGHDHQIYYAWLDTDGNTVNPSFPLSILDINFFLATEQSRTR